jgi:tripartite-type tricarboxylate transporter receptor subunit TctC
MNIPLRILAWSVGLALASTIACAQGFSKRPVRVIVPSAPGGNSETAIRLLLPKLSEALGQIAELVRNEVAKYRKVIVESGIPLL